MKLATFNIYWLGGNQIERSAEDLTRIAHVIAKLDADVVVFQEIVGLEALQQVLSTVNDITARNYQLFDKDHNLLGVGKPPDQKVVVVYDEQRYSLMASPIFGGVRRLPFGLRLQSVADSGQILVVGVHFQSGWPTFTDEGDAKTRKRQCQHLADWVAGEKQAKNPVLPAPLPGEHVAILGDFNALYQSDNSAFAHVVASFDPLRSGPLAEWWWQEPRADPAGGDHTTSYLEHLLIDYVMLSPSLKERIIMQPTIYAFDQDLEIGATDEHVSDHRPVFVEVDISPA